MISLKIKLVEEKPADVTVRAWRKILRGAHEAQGRYWHDRNLPKHFEPGARTRYGYQPRSLRYQKRKQRMGRGNIDLVFSGFLREYLENTAVFRAFPSRVSVAMAGPRYITMNPNPRAGRRPHLAAEVLAVPPSERRDLAIAFEQAFDKLHAEWRETRTKQIG